ncbi:hypothetical protein [Actinoplanes sp. GCM10030250]|uniref:hypothetical protein n=1 Tax=Actinoplanes sp. GCM10030250 TaxID=3273376 RepID=UPI003611C6C5
MSSTENTTTTNVPPVADTRRHAECFTEPAAGTRRPPRLSGRQIVLSDEADLRRTRRWLTRLLVFDRSHGCWVLLTPGDDHAFLLLDDMNQQLHTATQVQDAQQWAAQLIEREDRHEYGDSSAIPLTVTAWQPVRYAALDGYAPLTNFTPRCEIGGDLDPATGRDCPCQPTTTSMVNTPDKTATRSNGN